MLSRRLLASLSLVCGVFLTGPNLRADFIPIAQPDSAYLASTTRADFTDPSGTLIGGVAQGGVVLIYDNTLEVLTVPQPWTNWGNPPAVESATPTVGYTDGASSLAIGFSKPFTTFGVEIEPGNQIAESTTALFLDGATPVGSITRNPDGNGGALLFAASTTTGVFTGVLITNNASDDFAIANQRFLVASPEPSTIGLLSAAGLGLLFFKRRLRRTA